MFSNTFIIKRETQFYYFHYDGNMYCRYFCESNAQIKFSNRIERAFFFKFPPGRFSEYNHPRTTALKCLHAAIVITTTTTSYPEEWLQTDNLKRGSTMIVHTFQRPETSNAALRTGARRARDPELYSRNRAHIIDLNVMMSGARSVRKFSHARPWALSRVCVTLFLSYFTMTFGLRTTVPHRTTSSSSYVSSG